jgi:site-specific DNA-methyltransferase (adenine-specific)
MDRQSGGASRFFPVFHYQAKASRLERDAGLSGMALKPAGSLNMRTNAHAHRVGNQTQPRANNHPTVKPVALMEWLIRLVTPLGGVVLDPFTGSGTTGVAAMQRGFAFIGIEREPEYHAIATARLEHAIKRVPAQMELTPA